MRVIHVQCRRILLSFKRDRNLLISVAVFDVELCLGITHIPILHTNACCLQVREVRLASLQTPAN